MLRLRRLREQEQDRPFEDDSALFDVVMQDSFTVSVASERDVAGPRVYYERSTKLICGDECALEPRGSKDLDRDLRDGIESDDVPERFTRGLTCAWRTTIAVCEPLSAHDSLWLLNDLQPPIRKTKEVG